MTLISIKSADNWKYDMFTTKLTITETYNTVVVLKLFGCTD